MTAFFRLPAFHMQLSYLKRCLPLLALWLAACAVQPPHDYATDSPLWLQHQQQVRQISQYQARGSFAWLAAKQKVYARFFWQQTSAESYRLLLTSPLGNTEMDLQVAPGIAQLIDNKGQRHTDPDAQRLIRDLSGLDLPLDSLRQWLLGLPGDSDDYQLNKAYRLQSLNWQQGGQHWQVRYRDYYDAQHHGKTVQPALPKELELHQGDVRIKLKINQWTLADAQPAAQQLTR